jgi:hypothetical protein
MLNGWPGRVRTEQLECQRCVGGEAELRLTFGDYFEKASRCVWARKGRSTVGDERRIGQGVRDYGDSPAGPACLGGSRDWAWR